MSGRYPMIWDDETLLRRDPPPWSLTGHMLLWHDGSPAHVQQEPFVQSRDGWEASLRISRSTREGTRWLTLQMRLDGSVRAEWEARGTSARARALQALAIYMELREWYDDSLGRLDLK
jgi:hypothetical protein